MTDIDREIDEELRQDRAAEMWAKFSPVVYGLASVIVLGVAAWQFQAYRARQAAEEAFGKYLSAAELAQDGKSAEAAAAFTALSASDAKGLGELAQLRAAAELSVKDRDGAVKAYEAIAAKPGVTSALRDMARLRAALLRADSADRKELEERLAPLAASGQPFRATAREILGLAALKADDFETAGRYFDQIVTDNDAPASTKQRAEAYLAIVRSSRKS
jgi:hypothetical protein